MPPNATQNASATKMAAWLGPCASLLCLVHCVGFALLAVLAPSFSSFLPHTEWMDWGVFTTVALSGAYALRNFRAGRIAWSLFAALALVGLGLLVAEAHGWGHFVVVALSLIQIPFIFKHFSERRKPPCCEHDAA